MPLVSVVLCTYNDERFISNTIQSVLEQSFRDFEFIIWNDGSTDRTESIVRSFNDDRIRYFYHDNVGLGIALSKACKEAKGKYIARIDGDDICMLDRFSIEVAFLESHPEVVLVSSSVIYIDESGIVLGRSFPWTWHRNIRKCINVVHPAVMFRRDIYNRTCGYLDARSAQDRILWPKMLKFGEFHIIKQPLVYYRLLSSSLSHSTSSNSPYSAMLEIIRRKMAADDEVTDIDLALQNKLYDLSKKRNNNSFYVYTASYEEKLCSFFKKFMPSIFAENIVFFMKNIYAFIKY